MVWVSGQAAWHYCCRLHGNPVENICSKDPGTATQDSKHIAGLAGSFRFSHQHQMCVSRLSDTMMNSTNSAMQYIHVACRSATNTTGVLGRNRAYLYIHRNLGGDPALDGHDAEVNARIAQINELLRVRDGLDRICELTKSEVAEFLSHISTFLMCGVGGVVGVRLSCCLILLSKPSKTVLLGGRAPMTSSIS